MGFYTKRKNNERDVENLVKKIHTVMAKKKMEKKKGLTVYKTSMDTYDVEYDTEMTIYTAEITFENGGFKKCDYDEVSDPYTLNDWNFLGLLSKEIEKLVKKYK